MATGRRVQFDYDRDELVGICEAAIVPMDHWHDRDSAGAHEQVGRAWALLRAGCPFRVRWEPEHDGDGCVTSEGTVWVAIEWRGFQSFENGREWDQEETFYLPTRKRLAEAGGKDWY